HRLTQRQVNITVQKKVSQWWERLTKQEKRPLFLAPDFDRWLDESDAEMELRAKVSKHAKPSLLKMEIVKIALTSLKKGYLFMYNLVQLLGFSWIFVNLTVRFFILGKESFYDTFHSVADMMYFCQMLALVETLNAAIGVTSSPVLPSLIQFLGRNFILFIIFGTMEEMQNKAVVFFVFYSWSTIEIFRYPFYMLSCIDMDWKVLTWLRYTMWIPLYPLGCLSEGIFRNFLSHSVAPGVPKGLKGRVCFCQPWSNQGAAKTLQGFLLMASLHTSCAVPETWGSFHKAWKRVLRSCVLFIDELSLVFQSEILFLTSP
ncbi:Very-long-chain (3R)-3-hydroxyacyl-CoA dehydratase 3, partial [Lemmus lemmus]